MHITMASPTLVALAVMGISWIPLQAETASPEQRDAQFEAIRALIDAEIPGPAERQKSDFQSSGYPDATWFQKFLDWDFADHFQSMPPNQVEDLGKELATAAADPQSAMPELVRKAYKGGGGTLLRLVNELAKVINPDDAPQLTGKENISAAEKQRRNFLVRDLMSDADREWKDLSAAVTAFENDPKGEPLIWNLPANDPQYKALSFKACDLRYQAIHVLYLAHIVLREVLTRGDDFGIDAAPVAAYYNALLTEHRDWLSKWDYDWADNFLPLKTEVNILLGEAIRVKVPQIVPEDVENEMFKVLDADLRPFPDNVKSQLIDLQLTTWSSLLRWRLELGTEHDLKHGLEIFKELQDRLKDMPVHLADADHMGQTLASCYILAARLKFMSKDVNGASSLLAEVVHNKTNRLASYAKDWIANLNNGTVNTNSEWGSSPEPEDPEQVLGVASAFLSEARQSEDLHHQRQMYMHAAVSLRNGILGLSDGYEDQLVDNGPALYERYAFTLSRLNLHYHAAIAAEAGLEAIANNIDDKTNPWRVGKDPKRKLTESGKTLERLAKSSIIFASNLLMHDKDVGVQDLYAKTISLVQKISPEDSDEDLVKSQITFMINNGSYDDAIAKTKDFIKTYPNDDAYFWGFETLTNARMAKYDDLKSKIANDSGAKEQQDQVAADLKKSSEGIQHLLQNKANLTLVERKAFTTALSTPTFINFSQGNYDQVIDALGATFWANAPADEGLRARMLKYLCQAVDRKQGKALSDPKNASDLSFYLASFPQQQAAYEIYQRQLQRIHEDEPLNTAQRGGKSLARVFNINATNVATLVNNDPKVAGLTKLTALVDYSKKAVADLLYPELNSGSDMAKLDAVAGLLWDMDDHPRAGHLYELFIKHIAQDSELGSFKRSGKNRLDLIETQISIRPELKDDWAAIRDLLEDGPAVEDWKDGKIEREQLSEKPIDYLDATVHLRAFRKRVEGMRTLIGEEDFKKISDSLTKLESMAYNLAQEILAKKRLAQFYRESGRSDDARNLYTELIHYDPDDPDSKTALVENVLQDVALGHQVPSAQVEKARKISISVREDGGKDPYIFWTAQIQIFELSANLNDIDSINAALKWLNNVGDISHDLVQPPVRKDARIVGDDPRVRRAKNPLAVDLAQRFLKIYNYKGVELKPSFEITHVDVDGKDWTLFVDAGAPRMVGQTVENALGDQVVVFLPEGVPALLPEAPVPPPGAQVTPPPAPVTSAPAPTTPGAPK